MEINESRTKASIRILSGLKFSRPSRVSLLGAFAGWMIPVNRTDKFRRGYPQLRNVPFLLPLTIVRIKNEGANGWRLDES